jgi:hypothetical protein
MLQAAGQDALSQFGCNKFNCKRKMRMEEKRKKAFFYFAKNGICSTHKLGIFQSEVAISVGLQRNATLGGQWLLGHVHPRHI